MQTLARGNSEQTPLGFMLSLTTYLVEYNHLATDQLFHAYVIDYCDKL